MKIPRRFVAVTAFAALLFSAVLFAPPARATGVWMAKCQASGGNCACCVLAYIEAAFFAIGGWN